jgi:hypothetical protein
VEFVAALSTQWRHRVVVTARTIHTVTKSTNAGSPSLTRPLGPQSLPIRYSSKPVLSPPPSVSLARV